MSKQEHLKSLASPCIISHRPRSLYVTAGTQHSSSLSLSQQYCCNYQLHPSSCRSLADHLAESHNRWMGFATVLLGDTEELVCRLRQIMSLLTRIRTYLCTLTLRYTHINTNTYFPMRTMHTHTHKTHTYP